MTQANRQRYSYLLELHRRMSPDSPEREKLEDELDRLWFAMTEEERRTFGRYGGLEPGT